MQLLPGFEPRYDRPVDLAGAHAIDQGAISPNEVKNADIGAGFLRVSNDIERGWVRNPFGDLGGVVNVHRGAELARQSGNRMSSNFGQSASRHRGGGHFGQASKNA